MLCFYCLHYSDNQYVTDRVNKAMLYDKKSIALDTLKHSFTKANPMLFVFRRQCFLFCHAFSLVSV